MYAKKTVKASPGGTSPGSKRQKEVKGLPSRTEDDDATVRISPGGPPPTKGSKPKETKWTPSPGNSLIVPVGKGLVLEFGKGLVLEMNDKGCTIGRKKK